MNSPQKWLRSASSSPRTGSQRQQSEEDRDGGPPYGIIGLLSSQERGICAPASSEDIDDLEQLAALLELSGLWVGEPTEEDIFRHG